MHPKDAVGMANSVYPDQNAFSAVVRSGSTLFDLTRMSENLGSLWYDIKWGIYLSVSIVSLYVIFRYVTISYTQSPELFLKPDTGWQSKKQ